MVLPLLLYTLFTLISTVGAFLIADRFASRRAAVWSSAAVLLFFVLLLIALLVMIRASGLDA